MLAHAVAEKVRLLVVATLDVVFVQAVVVVFVAVNVILLAVDVVLYLRVHFITYSDHLAFVALFRS